MKKLLIIGLLIAGINGTADALSTRTTNMQIGQFCGKCKNPKHVEGQEEGSGEGEESAE